MSDGDDWQSCHYEITYDLLSGPVVGWLHEYSDGLVVGCADCPWNSPASDPENAVWSLKAHRLSQASTLGGWPH